MDQARSPSKRDPRVDVLRGLALLMIFVDHMPNDLLNRVTLHNFGFCDAAEVFVLLAGFSSLLAYGRSFERDGAVKGLRRIALRCARIYLFQIGLLLTTIGVVLVWTKHYHVPSVILAPIMGAPVAGLAHGLTLRALPTYLDILPLYVVLLAAFPLIYLALRRSLWLALGASGALWAVTNLDHGLNLPNWINGKGWYFDPFAWQFLFTIGAALAVTMSARGGSLPYRRWLAALCALYLGAAFFEAAPWADWHLPNLQLFALAPPDKSFLTWPRLVDILALMYLLLSSARVRSLAGHRLLRPLEACGRHSLEVFSVGCVLALFGRLAFRTEGAGFGMQVLVNAVGLGVMCLVGLWLEHVRRAEGRPVGLARFLGDVLPRAYGRRTGFRLQIIEACLRMRPAIQAATALALCAALSGCGLFGSADGSEAETPPAPIAAPAVIGQPQSTPSYEAAPVPPRELMEQQP